MSRTGQPNVLAVMSFLDRRWSGWERHLNNDVMVGIARLLALCSMGPRPEDADRKATEEWGRGYMAIATHRNQDDMRWWWPALVRLLDRRPVPSGFRGMRHLYTGPGQTGPAGGDRALPPGWNPGNGWDNVVKVYEDAHAEGRL